jgi:CheY-like chemotaxis protein
MTGDLLTLCAVVASASPHVRGLLRQAAIEVSTPIEIIDVENAAAACQAVSDAEYVYLDASMPSDGCAQVISAARAAPKPPFTVMLAAKGAVGTALVTDAVAALPTNSEEAKHLLERSIRVRLPSRVLIVDDSSTMRSIVQKILAATRFPFEISEETEGVAAIKRVGEVAFDIVFLDYNMPGLSGLETLSELKRQRRHMTVIMMSAAPSEAIAQEVRPHGAAYLKKPFYPADAEAVLAQHYGLTALNPKRA